MTGRDNVLGEGVFDLIVIGGGPAGVCGGRDGGQAWQKSVAD